MPASDYDAIDGALQNMGRTLLQKQIMEENRKREAARLELQREMMKGKTAQINQAAGQKAYDSSIKESDKAAAARAKIIAGVSPDVKATVDDGKLDVAAAEKGAGFEASLEKARLAAQPKQSSMDKIKQSFIDPATKAVVEFDGSVTKLPGALKTWEDLFGHPVQPYAAPEKLNDADFLHLSTEDQDGNKFSSKVPKTSLPDWVDLQKAAMDKYRAQITKSKGASETPGAAPAGGPALPNRAMAGSPAVPPGAMAAQTAAQPKVLDRATAAQILQEAGGDKNKARQLAQQRGYAF